MNFFEEQQKENDLRKKSFDKIKESLNQLNNLSLDLQDKQNKINCLIEKMDPEEIKKELLATNGVFKEKINEFNGVITKVRNEVSQEMNNLRKKYIYIFLIGPAIILMIFIFISFYQIREIQKIKNNLIRQEIELNKSTEAFIKFTTGQEKYWYSKQDHRVFLDKMEDIKRYKKLEEMQKN